jgi:nucleotide-binding universal stress UspA family protein
MSTPKRSIKDHAMLPIQTILHPTDLSKPSEYALQIASLIACGQDTRLIVLHVLHGLEPPDWIYQRMAGEFPWTKDCDKVLEQKIRPLQESNPKLRIERRLVEGIPSAEILRIAEAESCDLIVMGTHGRTGHERVLMGSVAEEVVRQARCPVLTVKLPSPAPSSAASANDPKRAELAGSE